MAPNFESLIAVVNSTAPPPPTNFMSVAGSLDMPQIVSLSNSLRHSSFAGGMRLEGRCKWLISRSKSTLR